MTDNDFVLIAVPDNLVDPQSVKGQQPQSRFEYLGSAEENRNGLTSLIFPERNVQDIAIRLG